MDIAFPSLRTHRGFRKLLRSCACSPCYDYAAFYYNTRLTHVPDYAFVEIVSVVVYRLAFAVRFFFPPCIIVHFSDCLILLLSDCSSLSLAVVVFSFQIEVYSEGLNYKVQGEASINEKLAAASWRLVPTYDYLPSVRPN